MALLLYIIINLLNYVLHCFCFVFVWCPYMTINVSVQHNGGFLPDIILLTQSYYLLSENPFKCDEEVLYLRPIYDPTQTF